MKIKWDGLPVSFSTIKRLPTTVDSIPVGCMGVHESTLRSYAVLKNIKWLLYNGASTKVVLAIIEEMEGE